MADRDRLSPSSAAAAYDAKAEEYDWRGPEVAFGLSYGFVNPGESVLDIGIGTGLGSVLFYRAGLRVYGMDISTDMLEACRSKGFTTDLKKHDLAVLPYPYDAASLNHAVCVGVLHFFRDLQPVFSEIGRIVRDDGIFAFVVEDRGHGEEAEYVLGPEYTQSNSTVTMHRHSEEDINRLLDDNDFELLRCVEFPQPMDRERTKFFRAKAYVARRKKRSQQDAYRRMQIRRSVTSPTWAHPPGGRDSPRFASTDCGDSFASVSRDRRQRDVDRSRSRFASSCTCRLG